MSLLRQSLRCMGMAVVVRRQCHQASSSLLSLGHRSLRQGAVTPSSVSTMSTMAPSSQVSSSSTNTNPPELLTLYQYAICPYCNIAKALLNYTKTKFTIQEVNPLTKKELKHLPDPTYRKVPILLVQSTTNHTTDNNSNLQEEKAKPQQQQINGSESIVDHILSTITTTTTMSDTLDTTSASSQQWTQFARDELAPLLYPNLCNTLANSYAAFGYVHGIHSPFTMTQRYAIQMIGSVAMYLAASKVKSK